MKTCKKGLHNYAVTLKRCPECNKIAKKIRSRAYYRANPEKGRAKIALWRKANPEKVSIQNSITKAWRKANPEIQKSREMAWRKNNPEKQKISDLSYKNKHPGRIKMKDSAYQKANRDKINAKNAKRRAAKIKRMPAWLTPIHHKEINFLYLESIRLSKEIGIQYHVDHIVPLQGENVSGLHVPWNLQVLVGPGPNGNCSKGRRF